MVAVPHTTRAGHSPAIQTFRSVDEHSLKAMRRPSLVYLMVFGLCSLLLLAGTGAYAFQVYMGIGVSGMGQPVMWAFYITTSVFWASIGHSGVIISAILYIFRSRWRSAVSRCAETMAVCAIAVGGLFPIIHLGRPWFFYFLFFYPNQRQLQPDFHSPLVWDLFGIMVFLLFSAIFLYIGAIPDLATVAASARGLRRKLYRFASLNWRGDHRQWRHYSTTYLLMAGIAIVVVMSVDAVSSFDYAMAQLPGWHDDVFAPYFLSTATYGGLGMLFILLPVVRRVGHFENEITTWHFDQLCKLAILVSMVISYTYLLEAFMAWYSNDQFQQMTYHMRYFGPYGALFWLMCWCNCVVPWSLFSKTIRTSIKYLPIIGLFALVGVWVDYFVVIAGSLTTNYIPSQWGFYHPTWAELLIEGASLGMFVCLYMLSYKLEPVISMSAIKTNLPWLNRSVRGRLRKFA